MGRRQARKKHCPYSKDLQEKPSSAAALDDDDLQERPSTSAAALNHDHTYATHLPVAPNSPSSDTAVPSTSRYSLNTSHTQYACVLYVDLKY